MLDRALLLISVCTNIHLHLQQISLISVGCTLRYRAAVPASGLEGKGLRLSLNTVEK